jgi:hypothetical protein
MTINPGLTKEGINPSPRKKLISQFLAGKELSIWKKA